MDARSSPVLCPFTLTLEPMAAMLNFETADDPIYADSTRDESYGRMMRVSTR